MPKSAASSEAWNSADLCAASNVAWSCSGAPGKADERGVRQRVGQVARVAPLMKVMQEAVRLVGDH